MLYFSFCNIFKIYKICIISTFCKNQRHCKTFNIANIFSTSFSKISDTGEISAKIYERLRTLKIQPNDFVDLKTCCNMNVYLQNLDAETAENEIMLLECCQTIANILTTVCQHLLTSTLVWMEPWFLRSSWKRRGRRPTTARGSLLDTNKKSKLTWVICRGQVKKKTEEASYTMQFMRPSIADTLDMCCTLEVRLAAYFY